MRAIEIPAVNTVAIEWNTPVGSQTKLGEIGEVDMDALVLARENGSRVIWATVCLEKKLERVVSNYLMGPFDGHSEERQFLEQEILRSSAFSIAFKKQLIGIIANQSQVIRGKEKSKLQGALKKVIVWRNAFAHGELIANDKRGVLVRYYSGGNIERVLNEEALKEIEASFRDANTLVDKLLNGA